LLYHSVFQMRAVGVDWDRERRVSKIEDYIVAANHSRQRCGVSGGGWRRIAAGCDSILPGQGVPFECRNNAE